MTQDFHAVDRKATPRQPVGALGGHRGNRLLAALPDRVMDQLEPDLRAVELIPQTVVFEPVDPENQILFPHTGVISMLSTDSEAHGVEIATVGREGMTGVPFVLGAEATQITGVVQVPGRASRMSPAAFRLALEAFPEFQRLMLRYVHALFTQTSRNVACHQLHRVEQRCARWLVSAHDRVDGSSFELTQQRLSELLGVTRPSVSATASALQRAGLIRYSRGHVTILDRAGLEEAACDCYRIVEDEFGRLRTIG